MPHTLDSARLGEVFDAIGEGADRLTAWEMDFVESVQEQWQAGRALTEKQLEKLEQIYCKVP